MGRIQRRRRVRCKLSCEIVESSRRRVQARVVSLSEGGLAIITELEFDQGDPIRLLISPGRGRAPLKVSAIVWNQRRTTGSGKAAGLRRYGCVVSEPSRSFLDLLDRFDPSLSTSPANGASPSDGISSRPAAAATIPVAKSRSRDPESESVEPDLPRSRELQPPPKPEPEENWPYFRVRMKQIGGPRTRILTLRARSATHAETLAHDELARVCRDAEGWGVLHIARVSGRRS